MSYNNDYNKCNNLPVWIVLELQRLPPKQTPILFERHAIIESWKEGLTEKHLIQTIKQGKILLQKCAAPNKLAFKHYFGKENVTCTVINLFENDFIRVKTTWAHTGR